jgi:prepilin-type N-terminal cleavage/methylation domain-containing protein
MQTHSRNARSGFTLIELCIVIVIIAVVIGMLLPRLLTARLTANEASAIATLRGLASAQVVVVAGGGIDSDADGAGEDGYFGELAGATGMRESAGGLPIVGARRLNPVVLSTAFGLVDLHGLVSRSGYYFQLWLPGPPVGGLVPGVSELPTIGGADPANLPDANGCEFLWCCYAWPIVASESGNRTFFINQTGELLQYRNRTGVRYSGTARTPRFDEAFAVMGDMAGLLRVGNPGGHDATLWTAVH